MFLNFRYKDIALFKLAGPIKFDFNIRPGSTKEFGFLLQSHLKCKFAYYLLSLPERRRATQFGKGYCNWGMVNYISVSTDQR
jgi:hypothetical protein